MPQPELSFLFELAAEYSVQKIDSTPLGDRTIVSVTGGVFKGPNIQGTVESGGGDWVLALSDGSCKLDVRLVLKTDSGQLILMTYRGIRHGPPEVMAKLSAGGLVDTGLFYQRITPYFETAASQFGWLNNLVSIGTLVQRDRQKIVYEIYQVH